MRLDSSKKTGGGDVQYYIDEVFAAVQLLYLQHNAGPLTHLLCWFDNCAEQFKNQWMLGWMSSYAHARSIIIMFDFVALQHGKRTNDGYGCPPPPT